MMVVKSGMWNPMQVVTWPTTEVDPYLGNNILEQSENRNNR